MMNLSKQQVRDHFLKMGVKNLKEFGYPSVTTENILTEYIFRKMFQGMLEDESNITSSKTVESVRLELIAEIKANKTGA